MNEITHADYNTVSQTGISMKTYVVGIRSLNHEVYIAKTNKIALTAYYDKKYMPDENICVPFGHYNILYALRDPADPP